MKKIIVAFVGLAAAALSFQASATGIPALKLVPGCEACALPADVAQAFQDGYAKAAGNPASFDGELEVTISEFSARGGAARVVLGVFSGKDKIAATATVNGETVTVEDTARSTFCGIKCVAGNVGEKLGKHLVAEPAVSATTDSSETNPL